MRTLASFSEEASAWLLEPGLYGLWLGASLDDSVLMAALAQQALFTVERVHPICPQQEPFERLTCAPAALQRFEEDWHARLRETGCPVLTLRPVTAPVPAPQPCPAAERARAIVRTLTDAELAALCVGNVVKGQGNAIGSAGVAVPGMGATIKHFACNNQEDNRMGSDSIVGERALRELYLRGFEIAVKTAQPRCIMTSYNKLNGVHTANSADLCTRLAREEWGFAGIFMTDWTTTSNGSSAWRCVAAGNDLIMPGVDGDTAGILAALQDGRLSRTALTACAERMLQAILQSAAG